MKITFLGVGEASDEENYNISVLIESKINLLIDCGFTVPFQLWKYNNKPNFLDAIYISHFHADHGFGLPALFLEMNEKRKKQLTIIGQRGIKKYVYSLCELAYPGFLQDYLKKIKFVEIKNRFTFKNLKLETVKSAHTKSNYSLKISEGKKSVFYGGDGGPTKKAKKLLENCNLIIQECYDITRPVSGHFSLKEIIDYYKDIKFKKLALVHFNKIVRRKRKNEILAMIKKSKLKLFMPKQMHQIKI